MYLKIHGPQCSHFFSHSTSMGQASTAFQGSHQCLLDDKVRAKTCPVLVAAADHMETPGKLVMSFSKVVSFVTRDEYISPVGS